MVAGGTPDDYQPIKANYLHMETTMTKYATSVLVVLLLACGAAQASQWAQAGSTKDGARSYVDTSSIVVTGSNRRARLKMAFPRHTKRGEGNDASKWVAFILTDATFDCSAGTAKSNAVKTRYDDGSSFTAPAEFVNGQQWERVAPGTVLETVMKFVCSWKRM